MCGLHQRGSNTFDYFRPAISHEFYTIFREGNQFLFFEDVFLLFKGAAAAAALFNPPFLFYLYGQRDHTHGLAFLRDSAEGIPGTQSGGGGGGKYSGKCEAAAKTKSYDQDRGETLKLFFVSSPLVLII